MCRRQLKLCDYFSDRMSIMLIQQGRLNFGVQQYDWLRLRAQNIYHWYFHCHTAPFYAMRLKEKRWRSQGAPTSLLEIIHSPTRWPKIRPSRALRDSPLGPSHSSALRRNRKVLWIKCHFRQKFSLQNNVFMIFDWYQISQHVIHTKFCNTHTHDHIWHYLNKIISDGGLLFSF